MKYGDIEVQHDGYVALLEIQRPPNNFFDVDLINDMADALDEFDADVNVRAYVLCSEGKHFCAGANFGNPARNAARPVSFQGERNPLYAAAVRLFSSTKPIVAAVQGAAVGGGFGLAVMADFRVACPEARFTSNFVKLGFHPGFGLTHTLPKVIGQQRANLLFMSGRRINGETAYEWGLADILTDQANLRAEAVRLARRDSGERAPCRAISAGNVAPGIAGGSTGSHRLGESRTTAAAADGRPQGRHPRGGRTPAGELRRALSWRLA